MEKHMKDSYTNWRELADGNLAATETSPAVELGAAPIAGHDVVVHVPAQNANGDTLDITFTQSATLGGSYVLFHTIAQITGASAAPTRRVAKLQNTLAFVKCVLTVGGSTPNWGAVSAGVDVGYRENVLTVGS